MVSLYSHLMLSFHVWTLCWVFLPSVHVIYLYVTFGMLSFHVGSMCGLYYAGLNSCLLHDFVMLCSCVLGLAWLLASIGLVCLVCRRPTKGLHRAFALALLALAFALALLALALFAACLGLPCFGFACLGLDVCRGPSSLPWLDLVCLPCLAWLIALAGLGQT